ncbi:Receptor-like protein [Thalictrum thalictroides]|uniref:Receptor-like protein n=1 Tax=Thalictrum thalictroides TaxID=46969 RepID=A0A7J6XG90_THATH|nr:Receptor-like protein [Thalictrum thalictroides]
MVANSLQQNSRQPSCHDKDISALLQFKQSISLNSSASVYDGNYPKTSSWKLPVEGENNNTCCSWDGVECNETSGRVISLDLRSSQLYGSIDSNSSLFRLVHLQMLNLDDNNFNHSQMPTAISNFPMLMSLNIAASSFFGEIPAILGKLRQLTHLDISNNNFHGPIPDSYANLTQLQTLRISGCNLVGPIPYRYLVFIIWRHLQ